MFVSGGERQRECEWGEKRRRGSCFSWMEVMDCSHFSVMLREFEVTIHETYLQMLKAWVRLGGGRRNGRRCPSAQLLIVSAMRDGLLRGHFGRGFMLNLLAVYYTWPDCRKFGVTCIKGKFDDLLFQYVFGAKSWTKKWSKLVKKWWYGDYLIGWLILLNETALPISINQQFQMAFNFFWIYRFLLQRESDIVTQLEIEISDLSQYPIVTHPVSFLYNGVVTLTGNHCTLTKLPAFTSDNHLFVPLSPFPSECLKLGDGWKSSKWVRWRNPAARKH